MALRITNDGKDPFGIPRIRYNGFFVSGFNTAKHMILAAKVAKCLDDRGMAGFIHDVCFGYIEEFGYISITTNPIDQDTMGQLSKDINRIFLQNGFGTANVSNYADGYGEKYVKETPEIDLENTYNHDLACSYAEDAE